MNLDNIVNKMNTEFIRIKDSKENIGLDHKLEDAKGPAMNPLYNRLNSFLLISKPKISTIKILFKNIETKIEFEMNKYGESLKKISDEDNSKLFFTAIVNFAKAYRSAADDNITKRLAIEKANKALEAKATTTSTNNNTTTTTTTTTTTVSGNKAKTENIFGMFHSAQEASSDDVIAEFKLKMAKRMAKNSS